MSQLKVRAWKGRAGAATHAVLLLVSGTSSRAPLCSSSSTGECTAWRGLGSAHSVLQRALRSSVLSLLLTPYALSGSAPVPSCRLAAEQHDSSSDPCDAVVNSQFPFKSPLNTILPLTSVPAFLLIDLFSLWSSASLWSSNSPPASIGATPPIGSRQSKWHGAHGSRTTESFTETFPAFPCRDCGLSHHLQNNCYSQWCNHDNPPLLVIFSAGYFFDKCTNAKESSSFHSHCRVTARCLGEGRKPALAHCDLQVVSFSGAATVQIVSRLKGSSPTTKLTNWLLRVSQGSPTAEESLWIKQCFIKLLLHFDWTAFGLHRSRHIPESNWFSTSAFLSNWTNYFSVGSCSLLSRKQETLIYSEKSSN